MYNLKIRELNDQLRQNPPHGHLILTRSIAKLDQNIINTIVDSIRKIDASSSSENFFDDVHGRGQIEVAEDIYIWCIDAYDLDMELHSPDPTDDAVTKRILMIMTEADYLERYSDEASY